MQPGDLAMASVEPEFELSERTTALLLIAVLMLLTGLVGWAFTLVLQDSVLSDTGFRSVGASTLAVAGAGLLTGVWAWRRWCRDSRASRAAALRLGCFHAVMSETNRLILRRPNPVDLFEGVCEVCIDAGGMDLVVIDLSHARDAHRMGIQSLAAIPLCRGGTAVGVALLHSKELAFFDGPVTPFLSELGADLSFALDNADRERERQAASHADQARAVAESANTAKTEFLGRMSHELRTPLNAMLGFAQLLATDTQRVLSPIQAERVRLITNAGWHLLGLVNDVMDISRIESGSLEVDNICGDVSSVLDEAVALTQPLARKYQVELTGLTASKFGVGARVDPSRLHQVLLNLLSNACKYNRPGGRVRVEVTHAGDEVMFDVIDNGVGMTAEQQSHLFEPFNRLGHGGKAIEGSGIGLTLTRQLVAMLNGRLEIESSPASGTRARIVLPSCAIPLRAEASPATQRPARESALRAVVLYIEDDPVNQTLVEQMLLRCEGIELLQAETGAAGIALAQQRQPDLVLLDMNLPDMTGADVLAAFRVDLRTEMLRVVAVSANAMPSDVNSAMELGVLDYWTKPLKLDAFLAGVSMLLRPIDAQEERSSVALCAEMK